MRPTTLLRLGLALLLLCAGCSKESLPDGSALAGEDLGLGIRLRMDREAAQQASGPASSAAVIEFSTPEALLNRKPYEERPADKDLVVCIYSEEFADPSDKAAIAANAIYELKCYLAPVGVSKLTLQGQNIAAMNPDDMVALLGQPFTPMQASPDGKWHLSWYFALTELPGKALRVTSSHEVDGHCFALEFAETEAPK